MIALLQARHSEVLAQLISKQGGVPLLAPCLREVRVEDPALVQSALERIRLEPPRLVIFQTGVGVRDLFAIAAELGLEPVLRERLGGATVLARGPKPLAALHHLGIEVALRTVEPHTTAEVVSALETLAGQIAGEVALLQHFGAANRRLDDLLSGWGARVIDLFPYTWALPEDTEPIRSFLGELQASRIGATLFTSSPQVGNLWTVAAVAGEGEALAGWLSSRTVVASIGPTTTAALRARGIIPRVEPSRPKMVPLVEALCAHFAG